jgi:hypothetical protein
MLDLQHRLLLWHASSDAWHGDEEDEEAVGALWDHNRTVQDA